ncbi:hypothetical protein CapIbe_007890 [Capra ibex]
MPQNPFHPHEEEPTKGEWTLREKQSWTTCCADWQVKARRSAFSLWDLAVKVAGLVETNEDHRPFIHQQTRE